jgi:hypothetical protein
MFSPIEAKSLATFMARWVKLGDIADRHKTNRSLMHRALEAAGVMAIGGEGEITRFFRRRDLRTLNMYDALDAAALFKGKASGTYEKELATRKIAV